jgi:hypothetical protein
MSGVFDDGNHVRARLRHVDQIATRSDREGKRIRLRRIKKKPEKKMRWQKVSLGEKKYMFNEVYIMLRGNEETSGDTTTRNI